jgi:diacylglycerol kinase (ATP)
MTAKVILNPYAGRWLAQERKNDLEIALRESGVDFDLEVTNGPDHGIELARQAVQQGFNPIIAAGGDGTYSEVVNGIAQATDNDGSITFGVIPLGTANDLVDNLGLPRDLKAAAQVIANGKVHLMDLCKVNDRYFDNNAAIGLEPYVTLIQQRMKRLKGILRYMTATIMAVLYKPQWDMHLEWDGGKYSGPVSLVTVGNSPRTGGLFYMTPHANPFDGLLTFVHGFMPTRFKILSLLPRTTQPGDGNYVEHPAVYEISTSWLKVRTDQPTPAHADGEIISEAIHELDYQVYPKCLPILLEKNPYVE